MKTYGCGGINWAWYLDVKFINGQAEILKHYRCHYDAEGHPKTSGSYHLTEAKGRIVTKVTLFENGKGTEYRVSNPKHIFSYGG